MDNKVDFLLETEGLILEMEDAEKHKAEQSNRVSAYLFILIRQQTNMNRKEFAEWLGIPYRTMQDWELGNSQVPDYILRLVAYKVKNEKEKGNI